jgi:hypothetical protein
VYRDEEEEKSKMASEVCAVRGFMQSREANPKIELD